MVPPEVTGLSFHASLLMRLGRIAELALEPPKRAEHNESCRLLPLVSSQDLLYCRSQVVIAQLPKHPGVIRKGPLMRLQKCLLGGMQKRAVEGPAARHAPHRKHLQL